MPLTSSIAGADEETRTPDLLITSELLYLLSYVGSKDLEELDFKRPPCGLVGRGQLDVHYMLFHLMGELQRIEDVAYAPLDLGQPQLILFRR